MVDLEQLGRIASEPVHYVAKAIRLGLLAFLGTTLLMWVVNALLDLRELNFAVLFLVAIAAFWIATSPKTLPAFIGMKVATPDLANRVQSVFISVVYNTMLVAAFLASWSFADKPSAFFPFAAGVLLLLMWQLYHNEKAGFAKGLQFWYIAGIIGLALTSTFGFNPVSAVQENMERLGSNTDDSSSPKVIAEILVDPVNGTTFEIAAGQEIVLNLSQFDEKKQPFVFVWEVTDPELQKQNFAGGDFARPVQVVPNYDNYWDRGVLKARLRAVDKTFDEVGRRTVTLRVFQKSY